MPLAKNQKPNKSQIRNLNNQSCLCIWNLIFVIYPYGPVRAYCVPQVLYFDPARAGWYFYLGYRWFYGEMLA